MYVCMYVYIYMHNKPFIFSGSGVGDPNLKLRVLGDLSVCWLFVNLVTHHTTCHFMPPAVADFHPFCHICKQLTSQKSDGRAEQTK